MGGNQKFEGGKPWEECRGIGASFGYNRNEDYDQYRTAPELIRLLVELSSHGGNLLLDIGPTADGRIPVIMQDRLIEMGKWLKKNGEAVYGTTTGPWRKASFSGAATVKGTTLYLHVFAWPEGHLAVPGLKGEILDVETVDPTLGAAKFEVKEEGGAGCCTLTARANSTLPPP